MTLTPPALLERLPPIWQVPSLPRLSGNSRPADFGRRLHRRQRAPGLGDQPLAARIDRADPVEAGQAQDQLPAGMVGNAAADQPGVAALRHDGHPGRRRQRHERRHLLARARPHHGCSHPVDVAPEVDLVGRPIPGCVQYPLAADDRGATVEEAGGQGVGIEWHEQAAQ